jgi:type I restriction enzyme S subunit
MLSLSSDFAEFETMGTVFGCMGKKHFLDVKCICPPTEIVETLERLAFPLDHGIESNENQSRALAAIRDALLPKLMSGEIRVKDAEKFVGRTI